MAEQKKPHEMTLEELRARWPRTLAQKERYGTLTPRERSRLERLRRQAKIEKEEE